MSEHFQTRTPWPTLITHYLHNGYVWAVTISLVLSWFVVGNDGDKANAMMEYRLKVLTWAIATLPVVLLVTLLYMAFSYSRKARYAEIMARLHDIHHGLRDLFSDMKRFQHQRIPSADVIPDVRDRYRSLCIPKLQQILSMFADSLAIASGVTCRAAIKMIGQSDAKEGHAFDRLYVKTLVRDINSAQACAEKDRQEKETNLVSQNTDFEVILKNKRNFYASGNISLEEDYENSSYAYWKEKHTFRHSARKDFPWFSKFLGLIRADLRNVFPYVSVMVFPIRCQDENGKQGIPLGFLAVDSLARNCFWQRYDAYFGASVADALFHVLEEYVLFMGKLQELSKEAAK